MRKDDSTRVPSAREGRETSRHEPLRRWTNLPITEERARELVEELTRHETDEGTDALIELICGLMPAYPPTTTRLGRAASGGARGADTRLRADEAVGQRTRRLRRAVGVRRVGVRFRFALRIALTRVRVVPTFGRPCRQARGATVIDSARAALPHAHDAKKSAAGLVKTASHGPPGARPFVRM